MSTDTEIKPGYEKTKLGWIPEDWEILSLKSVSNVKSGGTPDTNYLEYWNGEVKWCIPTDITKLNGYKYLSSTQRKISLLGLKQSSAVLLPKNSILVCTRATIGELAITTDSLATNQGFKSLTHLNQDVEFTYYSLLHSKQRLQKLGGGSTFSEVSKHDFENFELPYPPLPEQKKIASILSTWDDAIHKQQELIEKKKLLKKGLMQQLLTGRKRFKEFVKSDKMKKTKLGGTPEDWDVKKLKDVAVFANGKAHENLIVEDGDFVVVNSKFISTEGAIRKFTNQMLSPLKQGDIAMVMSDIPNGKALAKCFFVPIDNKYSLNQRICSLTPTEVDNIFLYYVLNRNKYFLLFDTGVGQTNLRKDEVISCELQLPPLPEQKAIADVISTVDNEIRQLKKELSLLKTQKKGLMQQLLTGKKRVFINNL